MANIVRYSAMKTWIVSHRRPIVAFVAACAIGSLFEHAQSIAETLLGAEAIYQRVVTRGFRAPIPRFTAIITIREGQEPQEVTLVNVCEQRRFIARLVLTVADAGPDSIVIDKYFKDKACDMNPSGTTALLDAISELQRRNIPVVIGRLLDDNNELMPGLVFGQSNVTEGEITLDEDERRAPLKSAVHDSQNSKKRAMNTLSMAAALTHTPNLLQRDRRLSSFYLSDEAPFASLLPRTAYDDYLFAAIKVMCGDGATASTDWRNCSHRDARIAKALRGRIVIIGEDSGLDSHASVIGTVPGVLLQAMYVEAILDDALFTPISGIVTYIYGAVVFILLKGLIKWSPKGVVVWVALGVVATYAVTLGMARLGYYLNPGVGVIALVFGQTAEFFQGKVDTSGKGTARVHEGAA